MTTRSPRRGRSAAWGSLASEERLVVAALVGFALLLVAGTYVSWPLPLAIALTVVMLGVAVLLAVTDVGGGSSARPTYPPRRRTSLLLVSVFVVIDTLQGNFALVMGHHWLAGAWLVLAVGLAYGSIRLVRRARTERLE